jgi:hypothetical protein
MVNVIQLVLAFAIFYRTAIPNLSNMDAVFNALLVFGTIGYPKGANLVVGSQILLDFVLLAVFLAFVVGKLGNSQPGLKTKTPPQGPQERGLASPHGVVSGLPPPISGND